MQRVNRKGDKAKQSFIFEDLYYRNPKDRGYKHIHIYMKLCRILKMRHNFVCQVKKLCRMRSNFLESLANLLRMFIYIDMKLVRV